MERKHKILVCLIAATMIAFTLSLAAFAQSTDASTNVITTFADLKAAIANATGGTEAAPVEIRISGTVELTETLSITNGWVRLIGVGEGDNILIRTAVHSGDMLSVADGCGLILDNVIVDGGAVWANGASSTNNGINAGNGSIVYVGATGTLVLDNGSVLRNNYKSNNGGGVYLNGTLKIIDGAILDNAVASGKSGGAIWMGGSATLLMSSGEIKGNYAPGNGGVAFVNKNSSCKIELYDCEISGNAGGGSGGIFFHNGFTGTVKLGGSTRIVNNVNINNQASNLYFNQIQGLARVEIGKPFTAGAKIGLSSAGAFSSGLTLAKKSDDFVGDFSTAADALFLDVPFDTLQLIVTKDANDREVVALSDEESENAGTAFADLKAAIANATGGTEAAPVEIRISGTVELTETLSITNGWVRLIGVGEGDNILIRTAVHSGDMLSVADGCGLILDNVIVDGGAVWANGASSTNNGINAGNGSIVYVGATGTLVLDNGSVLRNNYKSNNGGGVYLKGTLKIIDGAILDNAVASGKSGGAIWMGGSAALLMSSGEIKGNYAPGNGGAVFVTNNNSCRIELYDCEISGNVGGGSGGIFFHNDFFGTVKLGGSTRIVDNVNSSDQATNLYFNQIHALDRVEIGKPFTAGAKIGLSGTGAFSGGLAIAKKSDDFVGDLSGAADVLFLDAPDSNITPTVIGNVVLLLDPTATGCDCDGVAFNYGNGTLQSPYLITSVEELRHINEHNDAYYMLVSSIDLSTFGVWEPLCSQTPFSGSFNGKGNTISGLSVSACAKGGLFAELSKDAIVSDLTISGEITVGSTATDIGGIAAVSYGVIQNVICNVNITVSGDAAGADIGGIVGFNGGAVAFSAYHGTIKGSGSNCNIGAIIGHSKVTNTAFLPTIITGHSGFGAANDPSDLKVDNTIDNVILSVNYGPEAIEVDVRSYDANGDGVITTDEIVIGHNASHAPTGEKLKNVLNLLIGQHDRSNELDPAYASTVKIQLDMKLTNIYPQVFALLDEIDFPYDRIILVTNVPFLRENADILAMFQAADEEGLNIWFGSNFTDEVVSAKTEFGLSNVTMNISYNLVTDEMIKTLKNAGIGLSAWTLNSEDLLRAYMLKGLYNITSRMQESLPIREQLRVYGTLENTFSGNPCLPEMALCTTSGTEEYFEANHSFAYACTATCSVCDAVNPDAKTCVGAVPCVDQLCQWCSSPVASAAHKDENTDHKCDYGCNTEMNMDRHADGDDNNHLCDYCNQSVGEACYDVIKDHKCDECGIEMNMNLHVDGDDNNHLCDYCNQSVGEACYDTNTDHACDECGTEMNMDLHADGDDNNHLCDYCNQSVGEACYDTNTDHACDECGAEMNMNLHVDGDDNNHLCDYGCGERLNDHTGGSATCKKKAECDVCGAEYGELGAHDMVTDAAKAPTCTETGLTEGAHCSRCDGATTAQQVVAATGHKYDSDTDASCNVCGAERTVENSANGSENNAQNSNTEAPAKQGLSGGAVAGIVIGAVAVLCGGAVLLWFLLKKKKI